MTPRDFAAERHARAAIARVLDLAHVYTDPEPRSEAEWRLILGGIAQRAEAGLAEMSCGSAPTMASGTCLRRTT